MGAGTGSQKQQESQRGLGNAGLGNRVETRILRVSERAPASGKAEHLTEGRAVRLRRWGSSARTASRGSNRSEEGHPAQMNV